MSDILIRGMEMPKEGFVEILIHDDGTVQQTGQSYRIEGTDYYAPYIGEMPAMYEAISVPPHGDLIERNALIKQARTQFDWNDVVDVEDIANAPTIIPAEAALENEIKIIDTKGKPNYDPKHRFIIPAEEGE